MRYFLLLVALMTLPATAEEAIQRDNEYRGIWVSTPYPSLVVSADEDIKLPITIHNSGRPPQRVDISVTGVPDGWKSEIKGKGRVVSAAFTQPDAEVDLELRLTAPENVKEGSYDISMQTTSEEGRFELPIELTVGEAPPPKIALESEFPALRGTPKSEFTFTLELKNDSGSDALIGLEADTPPGFQISFAQKFSSQELTSVPVKAGATEDIEAKIKPPQRTKAGDYDVQVRAISEDANASTTLTLEVTGQPEISLTGPEGRISGRAVAGLETPLKLVLTNRGTSPARNLELSSSEPSGWKVAFEPEQVDRLEAGETRELSALITPAQQAVAGDYMITLRANGDTASDSSEFRITVETSTLWGAVGVSVIAAALVVLVLAMIRYGRR